MKNDTGTGWVQRWFAKPLVRGSIPPRVSILNSWSDTPKLKHFWCPQFRFWAGKRLAVWVLRAPEGYRSFRAGLLYTIETTHALSPDMMGRLNQANEAQKFRREAEKYKAEMIAARKELSKLKRTKG